MKKYSKFIFVSAIVILSAIGFSAPAHAMNPVLSLSTNNLSGDNVQINVSGDTNASVLLFVGSQSIVLGNTSASGNFSNTVSSATYGIASNSVVYVKTGGLNGLRSNSVSWPYVQSSSTTSTLTLSQTALVLNAGQTSTITAGASYLYVLSNSSPAIANINLNANQITITANTYGSTVANICIVGSTTNCASVTITVQNSSAQQLTFSQNNFSIVSGQSVTISINGGTGVYTISNNSNSTVIQATLSGSTVNLSAVGSGGAAAITVCTTDMNYCGIINVNSSTSNSTSVTFSQTNPVVAVGQSATVTIYGGSGNSFYVSSSSNPSIVQANINSNILTLLGIANGTSTISVCAYAGSCASITANVSSTVVTGGAIALSQTAVSVLAGQSVSITISGGSTPYNVSSANSANIFNSNINGNTLTIYGVNPGTATANVCASTGCTTLNVTISSSSATVNSPTFSQNNILLNVGQQTTVYVTGTGTYYIANNSNSGIASEQISGNSVIITGTGAGSTNVSICQNGGQCGTLYITVAGTTNVTAQMSLAQNNLSLTPGQSTTVSISGNGGYYIGSNSTPGVATASINGSLVVVSAVGFGTDSISVCQSTNQCAILSVSVANAVVPTTPVIPAYVFSKNLASGAKGTEVLELQKLLVAKGFLTATPNGHYGPATIAAVKKFQKANGIRQLGNVGPATRAALNKIVTPMATAAPASSTDPVKEQQILALQQAIQQLLVRAKQTQGQ